MEVPQNIIDMINKPGRIGVMCTADKDGQPNTAYFGSALFQDGVFSVGLMGGRTLKNLQANPLAAYFCVEEGPVSFNTPGCRLYLKVRAIETEGALLDKIKQLLTEKVGPDAAKMMSTAVSFDVTEVRNLVDMG